MNSIVHTVYHSSEILLNNMHFHDCHQIIFITKGSVEFCINGKPLLADVGNAVICSRYENHSFRILSEAYERYILQIDPQIANQKRSVFSLLTDRPNGFCHVLNVTPYMQDFTDVFRRLIAEHKSEKRLAPDMEQNLVEQLLIILYRCTNVELCSPRNDIVTDIKRLLENRFSERYTLDELARQYGVSVSSLAHRFRDVTGVSVMNFLQSCRMTHAKRMLVETDSSISQIVELCGFSDYSNFCRAFRKQTDLTPTAFRKAHRG